MDLYSPKLLEKKYNNWIKALLALCFTKEGLEPFVCYVIHLFQLKCLDDICYKNGIVSGTLCSSCSTENVVNFNRNTSLTYNLAKCPNKICYDFNSKIQKAHRYFNPSYKNTDASQWCSNILEIAKCFMPPDGYKDKVSATATDFNGIISVILNHKDFQGMIDENLKDNNNVFKEAREIGNAVRHSPNLEVDDSDLQKLLELLQKLLSDSKYLAKDTRAQHAYDKLTKLENDTLIINNDYIRKALDDKLYKRVTQELIERKKKDLLSLESKTAEGMTQIQDKIDTSVKILKKQVDELHTEGDKYLAEVRESLQKARTAKKEQDGVKDLGTKKRKKKSGSRPEKKIKLCKNNGGNCSGSLRGDDNVGHESNDNKKDNYASIATDEAEIQTAKDEIMKFYKRRMVSLQLSVTDDTVDTTFENLYANQVVSERTTGKFEKIVSLKELLASKGEVALEIFLCGIAGAGKTTFAKYLTKLWCQSYCPDTENNDLYKEEDLQALSDIDFVFLLTLTDSCNNCNTEDMIYEQIIQNLPLKLSVEGRKNLLKGILNSKRCLIILDESDEWKHPNNECTIPLKKIPHRLASGNIILLTIARQRKLIQMKNSEIDKEIEISFLGVESKKQLQINALQSINKIHANGEKKSQQEFQEEIRRHNLHGLESVPLILMHLVCLWYDGELKGMSKDQVYDSIIVMLLSRTLKYFQSSYLKQQQKTGFTDILEGLGNLASNSPRESETIARSDVNRYLSEEQAKLCLSSGILSESVGKLCSDENIFFTFENVREHFMQVRV